MPITMEQWHAVIGKFNDNPDSYSYRTIFWYQKYYDGKFCIA